MHKSSVRSFPRRNTTFLPITHLQGRCNADNKPKPSYLDTVDPAKMYRQELVNATQDINDIVRNGKVNEEAKVVSIYGENFVYFIAYIYILHIIHRTLLVYIIYIL